MKRRINWLRVFKNYERVSFAELQYAVYNELQIPRAEMKPRQLRHVWNMLGSQPSVTVRQFANFLRCIETGGNCSYSSLDKNNSFIMGKPPRIDEELVPRIRKDLAFKEQQKIKMLQTLANGGFRHPLMLKPRLADSPTFVHSSSTFARNRARSAPCLSLPTQIASHSHWSERLSCNHTYAALSRQHTTLLELQHGNG